MGLVQSIELVCGGYIPRPSRNQIPSLVGQDDLLKAL